MLGKLSLGISGKYAFPSTDSEEDKKAAERDMQFEVSSLFIEFMYLQLYRIAILFATNEYDVLL